MSAVQSIFDKFSLQNLFRQFFCGFVFIVSFCLFASGNTTENLTWSQLEGFLKGIHWELSLLIALAVAACIIGTIIYHLEKNLYSYSLQAFFESIDYCINPTQEGTDKDKKGGNVVFLILFSILWSLFFVLVVEPQRIFAIFSSISQGISCQRIFNHSAAFLAVIISFPIFGIIAYCFSQICYIIALVLAVVGYVIFCCAINISFFNSEILVWILVLLFPFPFLLVSRKVINRTQMIWIIETGSENQLPQKNDKGDLHLSIPDKRTIAKKLATWSDFIHCTQSCCFAWIAGCWIADGFCAACNQPSVRVAFFILLLEIFFDWHRYQHVLDITKQEEQLHK